MQNVSIFRWPKQMEPGLNKPECLYLTLFFIISLLLVVVMFSCTLAHASSSCVHTKQKQSYNRQGTIVNNSAEFTEDKVVHENTLRKINI